MANQDQTFFSPPPGAAIKPYTGTFGRPQLIHLLRRTLFGVSPADMKAFEGKTLDQVVTGLLNVSATQPEPPVKHYISRPTIDLVATDTNGNPILYNGNKTFVYQSAAVTGTTLLTTNGFPVYVQAKDTAGNLLFINGLPAYIRANDKNSQTITEVKNQTTGVISYNIIKVQDPVDNIDVAVDAIYTGVKLGETWVNYRPSQPALLNPENTRQNSLRSWMAQLAVEQDRNLREKMTLFWHNHIATETIDVNNAMMYYHHTALLRKYALGNFKSFIKDVTLDPAMLVYLNGETNDGSKIQNVNENYGRELQELFCIGKGAGSKYTEDDVKAAARVLSGWMINKANDFDQTKITATTNANAFPKINKPNVPYKSFFFPNRHDANDKQFSAFYGNKVIKGSNTHAGALQEINDLMDMIFAADETSKFIVRKLYIFFVNSAIDATIEKNVIEPLAELFRTSNYEIKPVLKALFTSDEFYNPRYQGAMIKSPMDFVLGHARMSFAKFPTAANTFEARYYLGERLDSALGSLGQRFGSPPDVAGWTAYYLAPIYYNSWLDTSNYPTRKSYQENKNYTANTAFVNKESVGLVLKFDYVELAKQLSKPTDLGQLIKDLTEYLYPVAVSQSTLDKVKVRAIATGGITEANWQAAWNNYIANPQTTDANGKKVPDFLLALMRIMFFAAEYQLH
jgi:uncharacterized protein (DUF1800 family)